MSGPEAPWRPLPAPGVGLGLGGLTGALALLHPFGALGLLLLPLYRLPLLLGFSLVLLRGLLLPVPEPPYGVRVEGAFAVRGGFTQWEGHRLFVQAYPPLPDGRYRLRGYIAPPEGPRNPGDFDQARWLKSQGSLGVLRVERVQALGSLPDPRRPLKENLAQGLSPGAKEVMEGIALGEKRGLGDLYPLFQRAGLAHLLAVSGLHVGFLVGSFLLLYPLGQARYPLALGVLVLYLFLVGPTPSAVRAGLMAGFALLGLWLGLGRAALLSGLGLALFLHLLLWPWALLGLGFQLSYLAVLGIALTLPALRLPPGLLGLLWGSLAVGLLAQAFLLPLLLHAFGFFPLLSPLFNLLALPLVALLTPLGFLKLFLGGVLAPLVEPLAQGLLLLARLGSQGPLLTWGEVPPLGFALYYLGLLPLLFLLYGVWPPRRALALAGLPVLVGVLGAQARPVDLWFLDVGQGEASLARLGGAYLLVDGGRQEQGERVLRALRALGVNRVDLLVATHPDADHAGGLVRVAEALPVGLALLGPGFSPEDPLVQTLNAKGVQILRPGAGTEVRLGVGWVRVLWPRFQSGEDNLDSLVLLLETPRLQALLLADLPAQGERALAPALRPRAGALRVLKISHHGSDTGTAPELLEAFRPQVALIGVGRGNPYGHPHPEVLGRLEAQGVRVYRTDRDGAVRIRLGYAW